MLLVEREPRADREDLAADRRDGGRVRRPCSWSSASYAPTARTLPPIAAAANSPAWALVERELRADRDRGREDRLPLLPMFG
ncbi:MAG: hypothetical protein ABIY55_15695 [Kofleriaceae bacterium]